MADKATEGAVPGGRHESRARLFVENMVVYGFGSMLAKLVPFVMLPVVTRFMPGTSYYGLSDLSNTLVSFCQAFAVMGMYDAMFRMFFDRDDLEYKRTICSTALVFVTGCSLVVMLAMLLFEDPIARIFFGGEEFASLVVISATSTFIGGNNNIVQAPTRMQNQRSRFITMNLVTAVLSYSIAIPMLLAGGYLLALPISAALSSAISLVVFYAMNRKWFSARLFDCEALVTMLKIGVPLMPTFLFYWVFNSCDRIMIVNILGTDASGVYAIAAKMGQISQLIYTAFAQGWQYFAFSTMRDDDQVELTSRVYEYLAAVSFWVTGLLIVFVRPLFAILFPGDYADGVASTPYLFLSPLLLMLFQVAVNQLLIVKKTWPSLFMLAGGALLNVLLNLMLIPVIGIEGASVATLAGYVMTNAAALVILTRMGLLGMDRRFYTSILLFAVFFVVWRFVFYGMTFPLLFMWIGLSAGLGCLYRGELSAVGANVGSVLANRKKDR